MNLQRMIVNEMILDTPNGKQNLPGPLTGHFLRRQLGNSRDYVFAKAVVPQNLFAAP